MRFRLKHSTFPYSNTIGPDVDWPELPEWDAQRALADSTSPRCPTR